MVSIWYGGKSWWQRPDGYFTHRRHDEYLHRKVWEDNHGPIPPGHIVHHKDENPGNNDLSNLEMLSHAEHMRHHHLGKKATPEQIEMRRKQMLQYWAEVPHTEAVCVQCGAAFQRRGASLPSGFCSRHCLEVWRGDAFAGEQRKCVVCDAPYMATKRVQLYCSKRCNVRAHNERPPVDTTPKPCAKCGTSFVPKRNNAKFCQRACAAATKYRERRKVAHARAGLQSDD